MTVEPPSPMTDPPAPRRARWRDWAAGRPHAAAPGSATRQERLDHFNGRIFGHVEGWLGTRMPQIIDIFGAILDRNGVRGNIVEFGVHHGLFLFLLETLRNEGEECFAVDVFDRQHLNVDHSGGGSLAVFLSHLGALMAPQRGFFRIIERDTLSFSIPEIVDLFGANGVKFLSIDAGHTIQHACNDLHLAQEVLAPGGIVALDDYMSVHWPGVTEGFYRFINSGNRRLKPFLYFQNKLFLTTVSEHAACLQQFREAIEPSWGDDVRNGHWKDVEIAGAPCLSFS